MQRASEQELKYRGGDSGVKYLFRGPNLDWGVILLKPGQSLGAHYHRETEETFLVLSGSPTFNACGSRTRARAGDAFRFEPTERHDIVNDSSAEAKVVFIKFPYKPDDKVEA
jgi:quercetin dioxygenase-like cupin family protein